MPAEIGLEITRKVSGSTGIIRIPLSTGREVLKTPATDIAMGGTIVFLVTQTHDMGKAVEPLLPKRQVSGVQDRIERDPSWLIFFIDGVISVKVQRRKDDARCKVLTPSLENAHFQAKVERRGGGRLFCRERIWQRSLDIGEHGGHNGRVAAEEDQDPRQQLVN